MFDSTAAFVGVHNVLTRPKTPGGPRPIGRTFGFCVMARTAAAWFLDRLSEFQRIKCLIGRQIKMGQRSSKVVVQGEVAAGYESVKEMFQENFE